MKKLYSVFICCAFYWNAIGQSEIPMPAIPQMRQLFHEKIDQSQNAILSMLGKNGVLRVSDDIDVNLQITQMLKVRVNNLQASIERDSTISENDKYIWLRSVNDLLSDFITAYKKQEIKGLDLGDLLEAYEQAMQAELKHQSIASIVEAHGLDVGNVLLSNSVFQKNNGLHQANDLLVLKTCERYPEKILPILSQHINNPFVDSLVTAVAHRNPEDVYNYAGAGNVFSYRIAAIKDPLVRSICKMAATSSGRFYFPFLDEIYHNKISIDSIAKIRDDDDAYYRLLVKTEIEYAGRRRRGDTPYVMNVLTEKLQSKAVEVYINEINALHDEKSEAVRFRRIENLTPQELYYLCVLGEEDIYTSSYMGVYARIFQRMKVQRSDSLLEMVNYDFYKKFIRMAAAYNELDDFLKKMDTQKSEQVMKSFVDGLDTKNSLEDAVDVADSYASINNPELKKLMINEVRVNLAKCNREDNRRGQTIYGLLNTIFDSKEEQGGAKDASASLGISTVYRMPIAELKDASGKIIIQQFFYGDKDGKNVFNSFLAAFSNAYWKTIVKPEWVEVRSTRGVPIVIYANKPLDETKDLDAHAQAHLAEYLDSLNIRPTVVIHRGHSYYVKSTISQLVPSAKVILLGSCGGYHSLNDVLNICPGAHIIASKQVGTGVVNITLIDMITETLRSGKDLDWPLLWKSLQPRFSGDYKEKFDDYVPPHKNLGAIFIMAYNKAMLTSKSKS
ncbi:MAG: hypothetical protein KGO81_03440 [Bacteroidota bacterium]|nr:hypothetical protein [Bacteroidota bacterium]